MTQKTNQNPWTMDVRVRERNLKSGALTDKDLEKFLAALPDLADQAESFATSQPALAQQHVAVAEPAAAEDFAEEPEGDEAEEPAVAAVAAEPQEPQEPQEPAVETSSNGEGELS